jgi:parvulin-like peptidyl-prolyl isomerase
VFESEEEIRKIQKEIRRKRKTFSGLAKEYSLGPEGIQGGDLGYFEAGQMPEEFDDVFKLKINKISDIIRTPYGFHLFKVVGKVQERKMDFEESRSSIKKILLRDLQDKAFQKWFLKLKRNARIDIKYDVLDKIN